MYLIAEAEAMIRAGQTLVCWFGERITVGPLAEGGYAVSGYEDGQVVQRKHFDDPRRAVRFFRAAVKSDGLRQAVSAQRYRFLFPKGSSLEWAQPVAVVSAVQPVKRSAS
ncbi:MAG: hypothetical protein AAFV53_04655 [Myxococcota bacterium]